RAHQPCIGARLRNACALPYCCTQGRRHSRKRCRSGSEEEIMTLARHAELLALLIAVLPASAADLEKPNLRLSVGGKVLVAYLPLTVAEQRGYFKKEGLDVEINDFQGGNKAVEALVGGSTDIGCGAYEHTIYMAAKGFPLKAVALQ